jgi:L-ascorbate metabolism protein UlaG (beta-lactamase superfamily)
MIAAVITGITIVWVSESSQINPTRAAPTPTRSQAETPRSRSHGGEAKIPLRAPGSISIDSSSLERLHTRRIGTSDTITYVGHATVLIEVDGTRVLSDPFLRSRIGPLVRHGAAPAPGTTDALDAVLVSHLHRDHADLGSLRRLGRDVPLLVPPGSREFFGRRGFRVVTELAPGESSPVGRLTVTAVEARHHAGRRRFASEAQAIGFLVHGQRRVYFAGDTDFFDGMRDLDPALDLALLPVWGWGPTLGPGHLDPAGAARAAAAISPRLAVPIHWGTLYPLGLERLGGDPLRRPGREFAERLHELAPHVETRVLSPGESTSLA